MIHAQETDTLYSEMPGVYPEPFDNQYEHHIKEEFIQDATPDGNIPPLTPTYPPTEAVAILPKTEPTMSHVKTDKVTIENVTDKD